MARVEREFDKIDDDHMKLEEHNNNISQLTDSPLTPKLEPNNMSVRFCRMAYAWKSQIGTYFVWGLCK
jgi:hypothetical protein